MIAPALHYFREVAACGSIRRAADKLSIAPSAISRQISKLEAQLQTTLLDRRAQRLALTPAGEKVLAYAAQAALDLGQLRADLQDLTGLNAGEVRLASVEGMVSYFLSRYLANYGRQYPAVRLQVSIVGSRTVLDVLGSGQADLALAFNLPKRHPFREHARLEQPLCVIAAPTHDLACRRSLSFKDLQGCRVALPDRSYQIRCLVDRIAQHAKVKLDLVSETNSLEMIKGLVRNSQLISFLPRYAALHEIASGDLSALPLQERAFASTSISLITARDHRLSLAARTLLDTLKAGMARYGSQAPHAEAATAPGVAHQATPACRDQAAQADGP